MNENLELSVEQEHNNMQTNTKVSVIQELGNNVDYNSKEFRKGLEIIKRQNYKTTENQNRNQEKMYDTFNI